jgi:hypothetical protein
VHTHLWNVVGGAHLLLALAGWTFARFVLVGEPTQATPTRKPVPPRRGLPRRILDSTARLAVPSMVWIAFRALLHGVR